jgi:hypothetical protein
MSKTGRPQKTNGSVYQRPKSAVWWMRYRDAAGTLRKESTGEMDRQQAERALRSRLDERDVGRLPIVLVGKTQISMNGPTGSWTSVPDRRSGLRRPIWRTSTR